MRFKDKRTGAIYEPRSKVVAVQMAANPALEVVGGIPVDLNGLSVADLRARCEERGLEVPKKATKAELVARLS